MGDFSNLQAYIQDDCSDLPPGFRFHPTDFEIIDSYLQEKMLDRSFNPRAIGEVDMNTCEPWHLPSKAKMGKKEWYFFCKRDRKYPTGMRTNRATKAGYWKATGKDKPIYNKGTRRLVGMKKTLVFYEGRAPKGVKTNWVMHEFRLDGKAACTNTEMEEWVVARVFHKDTEEEKKNPGIDGMTFFTNSFHSDEGDLPPLVDPDLYFETREPSSSIIIINSNHGGGGAVDLKRLASTSAMVPNTYTSNYCQQVTPQPRIVPPAPQFAPSSHTSSPDCSSGGVDFKPVATSSTMPYPYTSNYGHQVVTPQPQIFVPPATQFSPLLANMNTDYLHRSWSNSAFAGSHYIGAMLRASGVGTQTAMVVPKMEYSTVERPLPVVNAGRQAPGVQNQMASWGSESSAAGVQNPEVGINSIYGDEVDLKSMFLSDDQMQRIDFLWDRKNSV